MVLLGDLNAEPGTPEVSTLLDRLTDAWASVGVGDGYTFSSTTPRTRIDYVMSAEGVVARTATVVASTASDHLPLAVALTLSRGSG